MLLYPRFCFRTIDIRNPRIEIKLCFIRHLDFLFIRHRLFCEKEEPIRALSYFRRYREGSLFSLRGLAEQCGLNEKAPRNCSDLQLLRLFESAIQDEKIVCVRLNPVDSRASTSPIYQLLKAIEQSTGPSLTYRGTEYLLVAGDGRGPFRSKPGYDIVEVSEAKRTLTALADAPGTSAVLGDLLKKANEALPGSFHPRAATDALILLRRRPVTHVAPAKESGPAITPAQMRKAMLVWIAVEAVDDEGHPWQGNLKLALPDGTVRELTLNSEGTLNLEDIEPGQVDMQVEATDAGAWHLG